MLLLSDRIPPKLVPIIGTMLSPLPNQRPTATALLRVLSGPLKMQTNWKYRIWHEGVDASDDSGLIEQIIQEQDDQFDPEYRITEAGEMGWK